MSYNIQNMTKCLMACGRLLSFFMSPNLFKLKTLHIISCGIMMPALCEIHTLANCAYHHHLILQSIKGFLIVYSCWAALYCVPLE